MKLSGLLDAAGGEFVELTHDQRKAFVLAVEPIYDEMQAQHEKDLLELIE